MVQGVLASDDWPSGSGSNDRPPLPYPIDIVPSIVHNCTPISCPPIPLSTNSVTLGPGGFFTMPVVIPEEFLNDTNVVGLQFGVRTNSNQAFTTLSGTLPFAATPFASVAQSVIGPIPASSLTGAMPTGMLTGTFASPLALSNPANVFAGDGSQLANVNASTLGGYTPCNLPCYWKLLGNSGTDPSMNFLGTTDNKTVVFRANNEVVMRYQPHPAGPSIIGGNNANVILSGAGGAVIAGGGAASFPNQIWNDGSAIVGGYANYIRGRECFIGGGWGNFIDDLSLSNTHCATITGGTNNYVNADFAFLGGGENNRVSALSGSVVGGNSNFVNGAESSIGGGSFNRVWIGNASAIGGGTGNLLYGYWSVIGGGDYNYIHYDQGVNTCASHSIIGGGAFNVINGDWATISGGVNNFATNKAAIGGGWANIATGVASTIPGGSTNLAAGNNSFAAGQRAKAVNNGAFVWSDSQNADFSSTADNQFAVRAQNGVMIQGTTTTLDLRGNGAIRVAGAGVGTPGPVFIHRAAAASISGHITTIDNPVCNGDPNAILIVTHNYSADTSSTPYEPNAVGVWYNGSRWTIYHENTSVAMPVGRAFNVMVIKP